MKKNVKLLSFKGGHAEQQYADVEISSFTADLPEFIESWFNNVEWGQPYI